MDYILVIDLGTACDFRIMETAIYKLSTKYKIIYLTDEKHNLPKEYIKVSFNTPEFFTANVDIKIANTNRNFTWWAITHPSEVKEAYDWSISIQIKLNEIFKTYDIKSIHMLYSTMGILWLMDSTKIPTYIYYYAPGILNKTIPWIFDSTIRNKTYKLYSNKTHNYNKESGLNYIDRIALYSKRKETIHEILKSVTHMICWDKYILPKLELVYKDLKVKHIGALLSEDITKKHWPIEKELEKFIASKSKIIFMSFGTYGGSELLQQVLPQLLIKLDKYCEINNAGVVYHNGKLDNTKNLYCVNGFIQYEMIIPQTSLVIFTGSCCLQNISFYYCKPMLFIPLLTEQFFWARNYKYFTKKPYIDYQEKALPEKFSIKSAMEISDYVKKISKNMKSNNGAKNILKIII